MTGITFIDVGRHSTRFPAYVKDLIAQRRQLSTKSRTKRMFIRILARPIPAPQFSLAVTEIRY